MALDLAKQAHATLKKTRVRTDIGSQLFVVITIGGSWHDENHEQ